jgi:hypothetical protein
MQRSAPRPVGSDRRLQGLCRAGAWGFAAGSASMMETGWGLEGAIFWGMVEEGERWK